MDIFIIITLILLINTYLIQALNNKYGLTSKSYLWILFAVHFALTTVYILYAFANRSDSFSYYDRATRSGDWISLLIYGTTFIDFLAWPFVKLLSLSYIAVMIIFSYFGYIALLLFYLALNENVKLKPFWNNLSAKELIFLLPNVHFWSSSLGKGSVILLGLGLFIFGLSRFNRKGRGALIFFGSLLTLMIRPHIFLTLITSVMIGILITSSGIKPYIKWLIFSIAVILFLYISQDVMKFANTESLDVFSSDTISNRAQELSKSKSGVDISNYNLAMKMFTFWFRPLFIDASGILGLIVSIENLFYLYFFAIAIKFAVLNWSDWNGWFRISIFVFVLGSFILAQVTGNLGIAMRQKAQFMPFFFIVYCKAVSYKQYSYKRKQQINPA